MTFRNFIETYQLDRDDIKRLVMRVIGADPDSPGSEGVSEKTPLAAYEKKDDILTDNELESIIRKHPNRGAIIQAVKTSDRNTNITVGQIVNMIADNNQDATSPGQVPPETDSW